MPGPGSKPFTFSAGTPAVASEVNSDFDTLYSYLNAGADLLAANTVETTDVQNNAITVPKLGTMPAARVFHSTTQSIAHDTPTVLTFNSERFDNNAIHDTGVNPSRLTCQVAGVYQIVANVVWAPSNVGYRQSQLLHGGATVIDTRTHDPSGGGGIGTEQGLSTLYKLGVGEYVEVRVRHAGVNPLNVNSVEFAMAWVSAG